MTWRSRAKPGQVVVRKVLRLDGQHLTSRNRPGHGEGIVQTPTAQPIAWAAKAVAGKKIRWTARSMRVRVPPPAPSFRLPCFGANVRAGHHDPPLAQGMEPFRERQPQSGGTYRPPLPSSKEVVAAPPPSSSLGGTLLGQSLCCLQLAGRNWLNLTSRKAAIRTGHATFTRPQCCATLPVIRATAFECSSSLLPYPAGVTRCQL